jgi:hypothetical protein
MFDIDSHHPTSLNIGHYHGDRRIHEPPVAHMNTLPQKNKAPADDQGRVWGTEKMTTYKIRQNQDEWAAVLKAEMQSAQERDRQAALAKQKMR